MAVGAVGKIRKGQATKMGMPKFSRTDGGVVYTDTDKAFPPKLPKRSTSGVSKQSNK